MYLGKTSAKANEINQKTKRIMQHDIKNQGIHQKGNILFSMEKKRDTHRQ